MIYVAVFCLYSILTILIGIWANKKSHDINSYYVADRNLGVLPTSMAYYATAQSSSAFLGSCGWAYAEGWASNSYTSIPIALGALLTWGLLANRVHKMVGDCKGLTVPDLLEYRFPSKMIRLVSLLIIIIATIPMMVAQIKGCGILVQTIFPDISFATAALIGLIVVSAYVMLGGMRAVAYTDVVQGLLMMGSVILMIVVSLGAVGGLTQMNLQVEALQPGSTSVTGVDNIWNFNYSLSFALLFLLSPLGQPSYLSKFFAMKGKQTARFAMPLSCTCVFIASLSFPIIGLCARILYPNLGNPDTAFTVMATSLLPPVLGAVVIVSLFAAVMSTADAMLLSISGAVVRDFYQKYLGKSPSQKFLVRASSLTVIAVAVIGYTLCINSSNAISMISSMSTGLLGASFSIVVVGACYSKKMTTEGALAGMLGGFFGTVLTTKGIILKSSLFGMNAFIYGFMASLILTIVVSKMTYKGTASKASVTN